MDWKERRLNTVLTVILGVLFLAVLIVLSARYRAALAAKPQGGEDGATLVAVTADEPYSSLSWRCGKTELDFSLDERGVWHWDAEPDFPLDDARVHEVLDLLDSLAPTQTLARGDDLSAFGLDAPRGSVVAVRADGSTRSVAFGSALEDGGIYADIDQNETAVFVIPSALWDALQTPIYDLCRLPEWAHPAEEAIASISIAAGGGKDATVLSAQKADGAESVTWRSGGANVTDAEIVRELLSDLAFIAPAKCVDFCPSDEAASLCGFDDPIVLTVLFTSPTGTDDAFTLEIGASASVVGVGRYARVRGEAAIWLVSPELLDPLTRIAAYGLDG